jgi:RNA polymerase sigma-70 factor (ECF subfamily)
LETALTRPAIPHARLAARAAENPLLADFEGVVRAHQQRIYRLLLGILRDPDAADTLTQECFLRAWQHRAGFRGESGVATWLTRIAMNLAIDQQRSRRQSFWRRLLAAQGGDEQAADTRMAAVPDTTASPERQFLGREQAQRVWQLAGELPMQQRTIFVLRFAEELALEEIAEVMDLQVGTVKAHLFRAVHTLRERIRQE